MKNIQKSVQLFKNPWMEAISRVHPLLPLLFWTPVIVGLFWRSEDLLIQHPIQSFLGVIGGLTFWTFMEYCSHRWLFHASPQGNLGKRLIYILHGNHHEAPNDPYRLLMPILPALGIAVGMYSLFFVVLRDFADLFFAAFLLGYLIYDYSHFLLHWKKPRTRMGIWMKQHHMDHHFQCPHRKFGVSSPLWDYLFRTRIDSSI